MVASTCSYALSTVICTLGYSTIRHFAFNQVTMKLIRCPPEDAMQKVTTQVKFIVGYIKIGNEEFVDWKVLWKKLKNIIGER